MVSDYQCSWSSLFKLLLVVTGRCRLQLTETLPRPRPRPTFSGIINGQQFLDPMCMQLGWVTCVHGRTRYKVVPRLREYCSWGRSGTQQQEQISPNLVRPYSQALYENFSNYKYSWPSSTFRGLVMFIIYLQICLDNFSGQIRFCLNLASLQLALLLSAVIRPT